MMNIIKIILFVLVNLAGYFTTGVIANVAVKAELFPQLPAEHIDMFKNWYFAGGMWAWIGSAVVSIGYFFAKDEIKNWLLLAPMYVTALYCLAVIIYFNYFFNVL